LSSGAVVTAALAADTLVIQPLLLGLPAELAGWLFLFHLRFLSKTAEQSQAAAAAAAAVRPLASRLTCTQRTIAAAAVAVAADHLRR
jgi:hypothetical protein